MNQISKSNYEAPVAEIIEVEVEKGFAQSSPDYEAGGDLSGQ